MRRLEGLLGVAGLGLGVAVVVYAHRSLGGDLRLFLQPEAIAVVVGGTLAALLVSFPTRALRSASSGLLDLLTRRPPRLESLVPAFIGYARKVRRQGLMAVEREAEREQDGFLSRALTLSASGMPADVVREALDL